MKINNYRKNNEDIKELSETKEYMMRIDGINEQKQKEVVINILKETKNNHDFKKMVKNIKRICYND